MSLINQINGIPPEKRYNHVELAKDLCKFLQTPYYEVPLGSRYAGASRQADVVDIRNYSYTRFEICIFECKVSRSDFQNEIRTRKYKDSMEFCTHFYFATEQDVCFIEEIPFDIGWIVRIGNEWVWRKKAKYRNVEIPKDFLLSLLFKKKLEMK
jgi:hypothetical protein